VGTHGTEQALPKSAGELGIVVGDDGGWKAMKSEHVVEKDLHCFRGSGCGSRGDEVDHLGKSINEDDDGIKARLGAWELGDEIHGDLFPWLGWDGEWLEEASWRLLACLDVLAGVT
jgi:hypothetical protein